MTAILYTLRRIIYIPRHAFVICLWRNYLPDTMLHVRASRHMSKGILTYVDSVAPAADTEAPDCTSVQIDLRLECSHFVRMPFFA